MVAPSGEQYVVSAAGYRAVVTESGATLRSLEHDGRPLVAGFAEDEHAGSGRGQLLLPWPNRVADGRYSFAGRDLQLPLSEVSRGHASHGLVRWVSWSLVDHDATSVELRYRLMAQAGYPWTLDLTARYAVSADGLTVTVTAHNLAAEPAPFAAGAHPYVRLDAGPVDGWELTVPAATALEVDDRLIPVGRHPVDGETDFRAGRRIGGTVVDTAFTELERDASGRATVTVRKDDVAVEVWMDEHHRWVQVYTGDALADPRAALAVEPMTAPPNAFNSGADLWVLAPGERASLTWGIRTGTPAQAGGV
jgi:aldose 1-epimerase